MKILFHFEKQTNIYKLLYATYTLPSFFIIFHTYNIFPFLQYAKKQSDSLIKLCTIQSFYYFCMRYAVQYYFINSYGML